MKNEKNNFESIKKCKNIRDNNEKYKKQEPTKE